MTHSVYGCFLSTADQGIAATGTAYAITYDTVVYGGSGITVASNSRITVPIGGMYRLLFSAVGKSAAANKKLDIWLAVNGTNVANSNTISNFVGTANERIITVELFQALTAGQYMELYMCSDDTGTKLEATAAGASPTRPACPSIIVSVERIGNAGVMVTGG